MTLIKMEDFDNPEHEDLKQIARKNKKKLYQTLRLAYGTLYKLLCNGHLAPKKIIVNPYLPRTEEIRLNLRFGQIPLLHHWDTKLSNSLFDVVLRNKLSANLANKNCGVQERIYPEIFISIASKLFLGGFS